MSYKTHPLLGKRLQEIYVDPSRTALKCVVEGGEEIVAWADGDCCSRTWIESVELCELPAEVFAVEDIDFPATYTTDGPERGNYGPESTDCVAFYGFKITTSKGHIVIDYRNDSNGYYGGNLNWDKDKGGYYGGVYGQNSPDKKADYGKWVKCE